MRGRLTWALGLAAGAALAARAFVRRHHPSSPPVSAGTAVEDPRAEELRRRLAEARELVDEREAFEQGEVPVDAAEHDPDARRRQVHEEGRAAVDEMRGRASGDS
jgi:hypothetical protein